MLGPGGPRQDRSGVSRDAIKRLKESVQTGHRTGLPKKLLELFAARDDLEHVPPRSKKPAKLPYTGLANYVNQFAEPGDTEYEPPPPSSRPPSPRLVRNTEYTAQARLDKETFLEKKIRQTKWQKEEAERKLAEAAKAWDPNKDPNVESDPYKTLFIARVSYEVDEKKIKKELESFGPIKRIRLVKDKIKGKSRGYGFVEFEHKKDFKDAYKTGDGKKIAGRRVVLDFERGRTLDNWKPRRLGGGLGGEGRLPKEKKKKGAPTIPAFGAGPADEPRSAFGDRPRDRPPPRDDMRPPRDGDRPPPRDYGGVPPPRDRDRDPRDSRKRERSPDRYGGRDDRKRHMEDGDMRRRRD